MFPVRVGGYRQGETDQSGRWESVGTTEPDIWSYRQETWATSSIEGYDVTALDGHIGTVDAATVDMDPSCIVVQTGAWIFGKQVLLPLGVIESVDDQAREVR